MGLCWVRKVIVPPTGLAGSCWVRKVSVPPASGYMPKLSQQWLACVHPMCSKCRGIGPCCVCDPLIYAKSKIL